MEELRQARKGRGKDDIQKTSDLLACLDISTVCDGARCPNRGECYSHHTATFLILGDVCTRGCAFCAVRRGRPNGPPDFGEPDRLAEAVSLLNLTHIVITSVTRDDLPDGGADHFAQVVRTLRSRCPGVKVELLIPDFLGSHASLLTVLEARPDILAHNVETIPRLYRTVRCGADYSRSQLLQCVSILWGNCMTPWRLLDTGMLPGALNMAIDQALLQMPAAGQSPPTLRFYQWQPPAVSLGYFQKRHGLNLSVCWDLGLDVVRRPTGGRAVLHVNDLTYSVIAGARELPRSLPAAYGRLCEALLAGFRLLGF